MNSKTEKFAVFLCTLMSVLTLASFFGELHWVFDLLTSFRFQYTYGLFILFFLLLIRTHFAAAVIVALCLAPHAFEVFNSQFLTPARVEASQSVQSLRVMTSNLLKSNRQHDELIEFIERVDPDVVVFQEYTNPWHRAMKDRLPSYPYSITEPRFSAFGIALYSKFEISHSETFSVRKNGRPNIDAILNLPQGSLRIIGSHPVPPLSIAAHKFRNKLLQLIGQRVYPRDHQMILLGDLNITPWSPYFYKLLESGNLHDGRSGFGIRPTWPSWLPSPFQIPIDHILISEEVKIQSMFTSRGLSSDHRSLWADLHVQ